MAVGPGALTLFRHAYLVSKYDAYLDCPESVSAAVSTCSLSFLAFASIMSSTTIRTILSIFQNFPIVLHLRSRGNRLDFLHGQVRSSVNSASRT